jgi:hypothetical protein
MTTMARRLLAAATFAAVIAGGIGFSGRPAHAGTIGNAPWCAVQSLGAGDIVWDCEYQTVAQCQPQVIAGNRGFCNRNPAWVPPLYAPPRHRHRHG